MYYADESVMFSHSFLLTVPAYTIHRLKPAPWWNQPISLLTFFGHNAHSIVADCTRAALPPPWIFCWKTSFLKIVPCAWDSQCLWRMHSQPPNISRWIQEIGMLLCTKLLLMHRPAQSWRYHLIASCWSSRWTRPDCWWLFYSQRELVMENACII